MSTRNSAAAALLGGGKASSSQPGTFPLGVGGAIAQRIAASRQGEYAFMSPEEQLDLRSQLEAQLSDIEKQEYDWRKGLVKEQDSKWDKFLEAYIAVSDVGYKGANVQEQRLATLTSLFDKVGVTPFEFGVAKGDVTHIPGITSNRGKVPSMRSQIDVATQGLTGSKVDLEGFRMQEGPSQKARWLSDTIGKQVGALANTFGNYGRDSGVNVGMGQLATTRMVQKDLINHVNGNVSKFLQLGMADASVSERQEVLNLFLNNNVTKGDPDWGDVSSADVVADREDIDKITSEKLITSGVVHEMARGGYGFDQRKEEGQKLLDAFSRSADGDVVANPMADVPPPDYLQSKKAYLEAQLARVEWKDPYADQVLRVAELQGFDEYKAALGIKGTDYESNRKAAMILAKDPKAASAAFKFFSEGKRNGIPEAKLDVMYRQYLAEGGAPEGGLFGSKFQSESARRATLAGMTNVEVTGIGQTISNYIKTGEFKYIQASTEARYKEFRDQWIADNAPEGAFVGEDGSLQFVSELLKGQFSNAAASWMSKQKVLDQDPKSETFGTLVGERIGPETLAIMEKDAAYLKSKATALTMSKSTMETADKTLDFDAKSTAFVQKGGDIETDDVAAGIDTQKQKDMALFEEMAKLYKSEDERQFRRDIYQKALREDASYDEALSKAKKAVFSEKVQPLTEEQRLLMEDISTGKADVADEFVSKPVTAAATTPVNKASKKGGKGDANRENDFFSGISSREKDFFSTETIEL